MKSLRSVWRIAALVLVFLAVLSPVGVGARAAIECDDFANLDAAQHLLDLEISHADALDADGDGTACNDSDEDAPAGDVAMYLDGVRTHSDELLTSSTRLTELFASGNLTDADIAEIEAILGMWGEAESVATASDAPADYADLQNAYEDTGTAYTYAFIAFTSWAAASDATQAEQDALLDDYVAAIDIATTLNLELDALLTEAGV